MKKPLPFILLVLAVVGLIGGAGYLAYYGKYFLLFAQLCLGVLAGFKGVDIVKDIFKAEPKPDEWVESHKSK